MAKKELPAHIARSAGGSGRCGRFGGPKLGRRDLSGEGNPLHQFDQDDGSTDPAYEAALQWLAAGTGGEAEVVAALANARVFVPIVATLGEEAEVQRRSDVGQTGGHGLGDSASPGRAPCFAGVQQYRRSGSLASRSPAGCRHAPRAALAAVSEDAELMVMDPGAALTFVVRRPAVWALASSTNGCPPTGIRRCWTGLPSDQFRRRRLGRIRQPGTGIAVRTADGSVGGRRRPRSGASLGAAGACTAGPRGVGRHGRTDPGAAAGTAGVCRAGGFAGVEVHPLSFARAPPAPRALKTRTTPVRGTGVVLASSGVLAGQLTGPVNFSPGPLPGSS